MSDPLAPLRTRFDVIEQEIVVTGRTYRIARPRAADDLIDADAFQRDGRIPYWADLWSSSFVLAEELARRGTRVRNKRLLDLGCGVGFTAVVAGSLGYEVLATDYYAEALEFTTANAAINGAANIATAMLDWRDPPQTLGQFEVVIAADVLYERPNVPIVARLFDLYLAANGVGLCTDPQRSAARGFADECRRRGLKANCFIRTADDDGKQKDIDLYVIER